MKRPAATSVPTAEMTLGPFFPREFGAGANDLTVANSGKANGDIIEIRGRVTQGGPVGPRFPGGLEGFGGRKNAGGRRKVGAARVPMIAAAVEALVMAQHQRRHGFALPAQ